MVREERIYSSPASANLALEALNISRASNPFVFCDPGKELMFGKVVSGKMRWFRMPSGTMKTLHGSRSWYKSEAMLEEDASFAASLPGTPEQLEEWHAQRDAADEGLRGGLEARNHCQRLKAQHSKQLLLRAVQATEEALVALAAADNPNDSNRPGALVNMEPLLAMHASTVELLRRPFRHVVDVRTRRPPRPQANVGPIHAAEFVRQSARYAR